MSNILFYDYDDDNNDGDDYWSDEDEYDDLIYEPEEISQTKYNIAIVERYSAFRHGISNKQMKTHFLVMARVKYELDFDFNYYRNWMLTTRLEIVECIYLPSQHCIGILKTFWLKLIQRTWKKICKERKLCIQKRCNPISLKYREIHGKWPSNCLRYPGIKGMLSYLSRTSSRTSSR